MLSLLRMGFNSHKSHACIHYSETSEAAVTVLCTLSCNTPVFSVAHSSTVQDISLPLTAALISAHDLVSRRKAKQVTNMQSYIGCLYTISQKCHNSCSILCVQLTVTYSASIPREFESVRVEDTARLGTYLPYDDHLRGYHNCKQLILPSYC